MVKKRLQILCFVCVGLGLIGCGGGSGSNLNPGDGSNLNPGDGSNLNPGDGSNLNPGDGGNLNPGGVENINRATLNSPTPVHIEAAATAEPTPGSVTQGSNVQDGVTTDKVRISFIPKNTTSDLVPPYHPIATITTGDGRTLKTDEVPNRVQVNLPSGETFYLNRARFEDHEADPNDPAYEPDPAFKGYYSYIFSPTPLWKLQNDHPIYYSEEFETRYGMKDGGYSVSGEEEIAEFERAVSKISWANYLDHPKEGRRIDSLWLSHTLSGALTWTDVDPSSDDESFQDEKVIGKLSGVTVLGFTDYPSSRESEDSDYLSWGHWIYYTYDADQPSPELALSYGAFADGEETAFGDLPLSGTASYSGYSSGTATKESAQPVSPEYYLNNTLDFIAEVNLTADFSNANASIRGTVDNFKGTGWGQASPSIIQEALDNGGFFEDLTITLGSATIEERDAHSFFKGNARATGLAGAAGKWGGQFFGTPGDGEAPPAAGGTWGVTQGENAGWKMLGGYGAWKTP